MDSKVVFISGSSSGIGASTARLFSEKGYKLAIHGTTKNNLAKVKEECKQNSPYGFEPLVINSDFTDEKNGEEAIKSVVNHYGKLDVLVYSSGVFLPTGLNTPNKMENYKKTMNVNLNTAISTTMAAIEYLQKTKGNIIYVTSVATNRAHENGFAYGTSKAGLKSFMQHMALELAPNIRVNSIAPGPVKTPIFSKIGIDVEKTIDNFNATTLLGRMAAPEEIAKAITYLASDDAAFIHGTELIIDGGYLLQTGFTSMSKVARHNLEKQGLESTK